MNFSDEQKKILIGVVVVGVLAFGAVGYYWYFFGKTAVADDKAAAEKAVTEKNDIVAKLDKIEKFKKDTAGKYEEMEENLRKVEMRLPQSRQAIEFFGTLNDILNNTGVSNERLAADRIVQQPGNSYAEIPYSIKAVGRFHELGQFLNLVEQNPRRFMRVKTLNIGNDSKQPSNHPVEVKIATFKFVPK